MQFYVSTLSQICLIYVDFLCFLSVLPFHLLQWSEVVAHCTKVVQSKYINRMAQSIQIRQAVVQYHQRRHHHPDLNRLRCLPMAMLAWISAGIQLVIFHNHRSQEGNKKLKKQTICFKMSKTLQSLYVCLQRWVFRDMSCCCSLKSFWNSTLRMVDKNKQKVKMRKTLIKFSKLHFLFKYLFAFFIYF